MDEERVHVPFLPLHTPPSRKRLIQFREYGAGTVCFLQIIIHFVKSLPWHISHSHWKFLYIVMIQQ